MGTRKGTSVHGGLKNGCKSIPERVVPASCAQPQGCGTQNVIIQWARDSAYRFFPLVEDEQFGLVLHPFDLATNKCLALAGRLEPRDWVDMGTCVLNRQGGLLKASGDELALLVQQDSVVFHYGHIGGVMPAIQ